MALPAPTAGDSPLTPPLRSASPTCQCRLLAARLATDTYKLRRRAIARHNTAHWVKAHPAALATAEKRQCARLIYAHFISLTLDDDAKLS